MMKKTIAAFLLAFLVGLPWFSPAGENCCGQPKTEVVKFDDEKPKKDDGHAKGYKPDPAKLKLLHEAAKRRHGYRMAKIVAAATPPAEFDVADMGWAVPPGDQANCGSCYLYSTVKTMSGAAVKAGLGKAGEFKLATQFGMDCHDFGGCNGGNGNEVVDWACKNGWYAESDKSQAASALYPAYEARSRSCRVPTGAKKYTPKEWMYITSDQGDHPATVDEFKAALTTFGCVNVALDAGGQFGSYSGGIITSLGGDIDHEIQVRGYSDAKQALLLENQWDGWGGAKSPGDNCAWLSYKAVKALQDPFVVHWNELPPPPPPPGPPDPPGPTPVPKAQSVTITYADGSSQTLYPLSGQTTLQDLLKMLNKGNN